MRVVGMYESELDVDAPRGVRVGPGRGEGDGEGLRNEHGESVSQSVSQSMNTHACMHVKAKSGIMGREGYAKMKHGSMDGWTKIAAMHGPSVSY